MRVLRRRRPLDDEGFGLLEVVISLTIAAIAFSALSMALISGVQASLFSQQNQQAGDLLSQTVEVTSAGLRLASHALATDLNMGEATRGRPPWPAASATTRRRT